jgi:hypothetical protein
MYKLDCISQYGYHRKVTTKTFNSFVALIKHMRRFTFYFNEVKAYCGDRELKSITNWLVRECNIPQNWTVLALDSNGDVSEKLSAVVILNELRQQYC